MKRGSGVFIVLLAVTSLAACSWLRPRDAASGVRLATAAEVSGCEDRGTTQVSVFDRPVARARSEDEIGQALLSLARNSAVQLGGNTLVPLGDIIDGSRTFAVYRCRRSRRPW